MRLDRVRVAKDKALLHFQPPFDLQSLDRYIKYAY
jgi:hypothetical protein